jgi:hypothetical protein
MNVTLDTNCIIDLEESRAPAAALLSLIGMHEQGVIRLRVAGISASERQPGGHYAPNFGLFRQKLVNVGLGGVEILKPIGYWDVTYYEWCLWTNDKLVELERQIHSILFPNIEFAYTDYCTARGVMDTSQVDRKWRNAKCDVLAMWCHIYNGGRIFVTSDPNFLKPNKKAALQTLGAGEIGTPDESLQIVNAHHSI